MMVRDWLAAAAEREPEKPFIYQPGDEEKMSGFNALSFNAAHTFVAHFAPRLAKARVGSGDCICLLMERTAWYVFWLLAAARLGVIVIPLNNRLTAEELNYQINKVGAKFVLCDTNNVPKANVLQRFGHRIYSYGYSDFIMPILPAADDGDIQMDGTYDLSAVQSIIFTSGTSGKPKAAQITFGNLLASATASTARLGMQPDDRSLLALPLYHIGGLSVLFRSVLSGTSVVLPATEPGHWTTDTREILQREPITTVSLVPTQLFRLIEQGFTPNPKLRLILLGGAAASPDLVRRCCELGLPVATTYGLTEATSQVATMLPADACRKPGSVGKPLDGVQVSIVDDEGQPLPANTPGEIVVRGETVMRGYLDAPGDQTLRGGDLHTGDIGYLDEDGDLWVLQRRSDLIVSGGENVYPAEVEAVLRQHPAIADACVVGIPDAEWGQRVAAALVLKPGAVFDQADVVAFTNERLAGYKRPRVFRVLDALPLTASGKIARREVQEMMRSTSDGQERPG